MSGTEWDAPNQQVVRPDQSGPWQEGNGGSGPEGSTDPQTVEEDEVEEPAPPPPAPQPVVEDVDLDEMTKEELLAYARGLGVSPANHAMTKEEIREGIDQKLAGS